MSKDGANKNKTNVLSLDSLRQKHEETFKMTENNVEFDGETLSYKMYERFPESVRNEYIQEVVEANFDIMNNIEEHENIEVSVSTITLILMIDKFTDIEIPESLGEKIIYAGYLSDFGLLSTLINAFEEKEMIVLLEETEKVIAQQSERMDELVKEYTEENQDIDKLSATRLVEKELDSVKKEK